MKIDIATAEKDPFQTETDQSIDLYRTKGKAVN